MLHKIIKRKNLKKRFISILLL